MTSREFHNEDIVITAYDWVPEPAKGLVRDLRLRWALEEAGLPYRVELVPQGTQTGPINLAKQPFGQIPTLTVGDETIFESGACLWKIARASDTLLPTGDEDRDACLSWMFGALNSVEPPLSMLAVLSFYKMAPDHFDIADPGAVDVIRPPARKAAATRLKQVEDRLGSNEHLVAGRFTVADLTMVSVLRIAESLRLLDEMPGLRAYIDRHTARPAFAKSLEAQLATIRNHAGKYETAA